MKFLIIKIGAIGDVIMASPMLSLIKSQHPDSHITWVCGKIVAELLSEFTEIDNLIILDEKKLFNGNIFQKLYEILKLNFQYINKKYDLCMVGHADFRYEALSILVNSKIKRKFSKSPKQNLSPVPGRHHTFEYLRLFHNKVGEISFDLNYPLLKFNKNITIKKNNKLIILSPGGAKNILNTDSLRRWPVENYVELADLLIKKGFEVVLIGSESDKWIIPYFEKLSFTNWIGKYTLVELIQNISNAALLITHDSGPLHLSIFGNLKVLGLFGPTNPVEKIPLNDKSYFIWGGSNLTCRPCYDGKRYAECTSNVCLKSISPDFVFNQALNYIG